MEIMSNSSGGTSVLVPSCGSPQHHHVYHPHQYELQPVVVRSPILQRPPQQQQQQQPKTLMVTSSSVTGENFHTFTDPDQYPDLLNIHPKPVVSPVKKVGQPLNPAALVIPQNAPAQFPHQFQHLIHKPGATRAHSPTKHYVAVSPLLSPPAQFSSEISPRQLQPNTGYVTLPRKLANNKGGAGSTIIDWTNMTERAPIYDGVGPRTSATGSCSAKEKLVVGRMQHQASCPCPTIPELDEHIITSSQKRSLSLKNSRYPGLGSSSGGSRDSSGSEVTLAGLEDSFTAYCEPFGKALPPMTTSNHKNTCRPDSIASTDSDLDAILGSFGMEGAGRNSRPPPRKCPLHKNPKIISIPADTSKPVVQVQKAVAYPKQLKGILKGGSMSKSNPTTITTNPVASLSAAAASNKRPEAVCKINNLSSSRESSTASSAGSPPPLTDAVHISTTNTKQLANIPKPPVRTSSSMNKDLAALNV
jgi:hypothetical protein